MFKELRDINIKIFDGSKECHEEIVLYQLLYIQELEEIQKNIKFIEKFINIKKFESIFETEKEEGRKIIEDFNIQLAKKFITNKKDIQLEEAQLSIIPEDLYIGKNSNLLKKNIKNCLNDLIPKEVKNMIDKSKT